MSAKLNPRQLKSEHPHPAGPLDCHLSAFALLLQAQGYAAATLRSKIQVTCNFNRWLGTRALEACDLDERAINLFFEEHPRAGHIRRGDLSALCSLLEWLRNVNQIRPLLPQAEDCIPYSIETEFAIYLKEERGLSQATLRSYMPVIHSFLSRYSASGTVQFGEIHISDITRFILNRASTISPHSVLLMTSALRAFFRFLRYRGDITSDLAESVPSVADWKMSQIPEHLAPDDVERLLTNCDQTTAVGKRDYGVLFLLARLGLRAGEVVVMTLDDIDWDAGVVTIRGKGGRRDQLPIPQDVGEALVAYLLHGRPQCQSRQIFVRSRAPLQGFSSSAAIDNIVRRALVRAGVNPARKGAHLLRHSLATNMLRQGASLAEIGEILRHSSPYTTEIYAKVDVAALSALAFPWPGGDA